MVLAVAILATPPTPVSTPTAAGLSGADLIGILGIVAVFFGLVLTALGALMLRTLGNMDKRVSELKVDFTRDFGYVWNAIDGIYRRLWNERVPTQGDYRDQQL
jgi:ABC-type transporter Mla maintaining outer membrane lipid asymmetry permease subunit MlaE